MPKKLARQRNVDTDDIDLCNTHIRKGSIDCPNREKSPVLMTTIPLLESQSWNNISCCGTNDIAIDVAIRMKSSSTMSLVHRNPSLKNEFKYDTEHKMSTLKTNLKTMEKDETEMLNLVKHGLKGHDATSFNKPGK